MSCDNLRMDESPIQRIGSSVSLGWVRIPIKAIAVYLVLYFELSTLITVVFLLAIFLSELYEYLGQQYVNQHPDKTRIVASIIGYTNIVVTLLLLLFTGLFDTEVNLLVFPIIISVSINTGLSGGIIAGLLSAFFYVIVTRPDLSEFAPMFRAVMFATVGVLSGIISEANLQNETQVKSLRAKFGNSGKATDLKQDFLSIASHALRTPLTVLKGYFEELQETEQTEKQTKIIEGIGTSIEKVSLLNETILKVIDFEANNTDLVLVNTNIDDLLSELVNSFSIIAAKRGITLSYRSQIHDAIIRVDPQKLRSALMNILDNAILYSPDNSIIKVAFYIQKQEAVITITDHGIGISQADLALLFEPFLKLDVMESTSEGMGLGLYFAKRILTLHSGSIEVQSSIGKGTTFTITLPEETGRTFLEEIG